MFAANPTLVLNADFQPLSYFPLSLFQLGGRRQGGGEGIARRRRRIRSGRRKTLNRVRLREPAAAHSAQRDDRRQRITVDGLRTT